MDNDNIWYSAFVSDKFKLDRTIDDFAFKAAMTIGLMQIYH